jgi:hypothetical protein
MAERPVNNKRAEWLRSIYSHAPAPFAAAGRNPGTDGDVMDLLADRDWASGQLAQLRRVVEARALLDGDGPCSTCGTIENPVWFTDNVLWNDVVRSDLSPWGGAEPILCVLCFVALAETKYRPTGWRLAPEFRWEPTT